MRPSRGCGLHFLYECNLSPKSHFLRVPSARSKNPLPAALQTPTVELTVDSPVPQDKDGIGNAEGFHEVYKEKVCGADAP